MNEHPISEGSQNAPQGYQSMQARLCRAFANAQNNFGVIEKNRVVKYKTRDGKLLEYPYASLDEILRATRPALSKNGLAIYQHIEQREDKTFLVCVLAHEDGGKLESTLPLPPPNAQEPKALGSTLTYYRRYLISALLGVAADEDIDEDGSHLEQGDDISRAKPTQMPSVQDEPATNNMKEWVAKLLAQKKMSFEAACGLAKLPITTNQAKLTKAEFQSLRGALSAPEI